MIELVRSGRLAGLGLGLALLGACNALTGIGDLNVVDDAGGTSDAAPADVVSPPADTGAPVDAGPAEAAPPPPTCATAGYSCVPPPPADAGWTGPFLVYNGDRSTAPSCPPEVPTATDENVGTPTGTIDCGPCFCSGAKNVTCTGMLNGYEDAVCGTLAGTFPLNQCESASGIATDTLSYKAFATPSGGFCSSYFNPPTKSAVTWASVLRRCEPTTPFEPIDCSDGGVCVPDAPSTFNNAHSCIRNEDSTLPCPVPWTSRLPTTYTDVVDNRSCSTQGCSCGSVSGATCTGTLNQFSGVTDCSGTATTTYPIPLNTCTTTNGVSSQQQGTMTFKNGSCTASGRPTANNDLKPGGSKAVLCCIP